MSAADSSEDRGDWRPTASLQALRLRAQLLRVIREFFAERDVLEVETPAMAAAGASDANISSLSTTCHVLAAARRLYLQTSPEFAMKRLLAAGSGPIYQICRVFRDGESGRLHNPEFTLLEWYRPGFDHHALMDEMDALLDRLLAPAPVRRLSYREAFIEHAATDPFELDTQALAALASRAGLNEALGGRFDRDALLDFLFSHLVQPRLGAGRVHVYDYPASQAALAKVRAGEPAVAERFEVFVGGIEIANGYHELNEAAEQRRRFGEDAGTRRRRDLEPMPLDERLLAALEHGLPDCAGVAVGLDRLFMIAAGETRLDAVMAFPVTRA